MINGIKTICSIALMQFWVDYCVSTPPFHEPSLNYKHLDQPLFLDFPEASEKGTSSDASINSEISDPDFAFGLPFGDRSMNALAEFEEYHRFVFRHYPDADFADPLHEEPWSTVSGILMGLLIRHIAETRPLFIRRPMILSVAQTRI
ncbi:hypothetical protein KEM48_004694 [Puccinia striiformis f. sp. tritici PST-130]|nr:hypothetical protein KEM48_004694 [Puccinia striiformis f. sp. tritici PST-130]